MDHEVVIAIALGTAVTLLGGGLAWVLRSVVANAKEVALLRAALDTDGGEPKRAALAAELRLWIREQFVSREDYVPTISRLELKMDATGAAVGRLEERLK